MRNGLLLIPYWNIFHVSDFFLINKTFTFKLFLFSHKFGFVDNIWACLSAKMTTGIINESQKFWLPDLMEFVHFSFRTQIFITILASYFCRCCIRQASFMISWFNQFIFSEKFCMQVSFFAHRSHFASVKSMWFNFFMSESIVQFKRPDNQRRNLNWKIRSVREQKCTGNINSPSGYQYRIFTRILQK